MSCSSRPGPMPTSSRPVRSNCVRNWVTGTIGTAPIGLAVGAGDSGGCAPGTAWQRMAWPSTEAAAGSEPGRSGRSGLADGVEEPANPPATVRTMATPRTASTVMRGSRFTAAIVTAAHRECPAAKPRLRSSRMGDAGKAAGEHRSERAQRPVSEERSGQRSPASSRRDSRSPQASNENAPSGRADGA